MKDPIRIREAGSDASEELRELFRVAKRPEPLTPAVQAVLSSRVASIAASRSALLLKALPYLAGVALIGAGIIAFRATNPQAPPSAPLARTPSAQVSSPVAPVVAPVEPLLSAEPAATSAEPTARPRARVPTAAPAPKPSASDDTLSGEAQLLNQAHRALASDPNKALAIAREHAKRYPQGQLAAERELILVQALVKLGRGREAEARGRELRKTAPKSIYDERLDQVLHGP